MILKVSKNGVLDTMDNLRALRKMMVLSNNKIEAHKNKICLICGDPIKMGWHCGNHEAGLTSLFLTCIVSERWNPETGFFKSSLFPEGYFKYISKIKNDEIIDMEFINMLVPKHLFKTSYSIYMKKIKND